MQIFISSPNLSLDNDLNLPFLDIGNLNAVYEDDIIIGTGTFQDELTITSLIDRGIFPFMVSLDIDGEISPLFKTLGFLLSVDSYTVTEELIQEIKATKEMILNLESSTKDIDKKDTLLDAYLLNQQWINSFVLSTGLKGSKSIVEKDEIEDKIHLYRQDGKNGATIYILLEQGRNIKIFRTEIEIDKNSEINEKLIRNKFSQKFKTLIHENHIEYSFGSYQFENITSKYKKEFLIIQKKKKSVVSMESMDKVLKLSEDIDFKEIVFYRLFPKNREIDNKKIELLNSIHNYLNGRGKVGDIEPFLRTRNLREGLTNQEKKATMLSELFIKFIEKIEDEKNQEKSTYFHLAMVTLKDDWESLNIHILTNIFYHIAYGIDIDAIIKKEYSLFIHNFHSYRDAVEDIEDEFEDKEECYLISDLKYEGESLNRRVLDIDYIDKLRKCIGEEHKLHQKLDQLYRQLISQEISYGCDIDKLSHSQNNESLFVKKKSYKDFVNIFFNTIFRLKGLSGISPKKISLLMGYISYILSIEDEKSIDCCYFSFFTLYADKNPKYLIAILKKYFDNRDISIVEFSKNENGYSCKGDKKDIVISTPDYRDKLIKCEKFRQQKSRNFNPSLLKIREFYQLISKNKNMDISIQNIMDNILDDGIDIKTCCENRITLEFFALFMSGEKECDKRLFEFLNSFKDEYQSLNNFKS